MWRSFPTRIWECPRELADKINALGWDGLFAEEQAFARQPSRAEQIAPLLNADRDEEFFRQTGIRVHEKAPLRQRVGKDALLQRIREAHAGVERDRSR